MFQFKYGWDGLKGQDSGSSNWFWRIFLFVCKTLVFICLNPLVLYKLINIYKTLPKQILWVELSQVAKVTVAPPTKGNKNNIMVKSSVGSEHLAVGSQKSSEKWAVLQKKNPWRIRPLRAGQRERCLKQLHRASPMMTLSSCLEKKAPLEQARLGWLDGWRGKSGLWIQGFPSMETKMFEVGDGFLSCRFLFVGDHFPSNETIYNHTEPYNHILFF